MSEEVVPEIAEDEIYEGNYPFDAGRRCTDCNIPLSRYTEGPGCRDCQPAELPQRHRIVREALRHYHELEQLAKGSGDFVLQYGEVSISFLDLQGSLTRLSKRKKEAVMYNIVMDWKQKDVAEQMGITAASVAQYVEQATIQVADQILGKEA